LTSFGHWQCQHGHVGFGVHCRRAVWMTRLNMRHERIHDPSHLARFRHERHGEMMIQKRMIPTQTQA